MGFLDRGNGLLGKAAAAETDGVDRADFGGIAVGDHVGRDVLNDLRTSAGHGMRPDAAELVCGGEAGNNGVVPDGAMAGEAAIVGKDDVVAELAIVRDVGVAEEKIVRADAGWQLLVGATVDRAVFAEHVVVADLQRRGLADVFQVLGFPADDREGEKLVAFPKNRVRLQDHVGMEHAVITKHDT